MHIYLELPRKQIKVKNKVFKVFMKFSYIRTSKISGYVKHDIDTKYKNMTRAVHLQILYHWLIYKQLAIIGLLEQVEFIVEKG